MEEIQEFIKKFIYEKEDVQKQIAEIEEKRTQLAQVRNEKKKTNCNDTEIRELGNRICELGNKSQELQNKLDFTFNTVKAQVRMSLDNLVSEEIRKACLINEQIEELEVANEEQKQRRTKFQLQRQEFFVRFGRMPELSENAINESKLQEKKSIKNISEIKKLEVQLGQIEERVASLAKINREFKNRNWSSLLEAEEFYVEPLIVEEMDPIEELHIEQFESIEEMYVEEFQPVQELNVETFKPVESNEVIDNNKVVDEIEELARAIVEEIVAEQTKDLNTKVIEQVEEDVPEDIIAYEEEAPKKEKVIIPLFGQRTTISNIIVKIEDAQLIYKAQMSDGEEIKIYPSKFGEESVLLRDRQNREECKEILINYAVSEYRFFDKKVINKIDPLICELLIECAEKYGYEPQELIYNYAMSFLYNGESDIDLVPDIIYNLSFIQNSNLSKKEKAIMNKICKNARKNNKIEIIETFSTFKKIKYVLKRLFAINNVNVLPEAKY